LKLEGQTWLDYISENHGEESLSRVELMFRAIVVEDIDLLLEHSVAHDHALDYLIKDASGNKYPAQTIWQNIAICMLEPPGLEGPSRERVAALFAIDSFYGQIFENFYCAISSEEVIAACKKFLMNPEIKATYKIKMPADWSDRFSDLNEGGE
tara:strand:+ start:495 stop:953 length:459 start_codon:yes stop_codon:yes gene_type:complete